MCRSEIVNDFGEWPASPLSPLDCVRLTKWKLLQVLADTRRWISLVAFLCCFYSVIRLCKSSWFSRKRLDQSCTSILIESLHCNCTLPAVALSCGSEPYIVHLEHPQKGKLQPSKWPREVLCFEQHFVRSPWMRHFPSQCRVVALTQIYPDAVIHCSWAVAGQDNSEWSQGPRHCVGCERAPYFSKSCLECIRCSWWHCVQLQSCPHHYWDYKHSRPATLRGNKYEKSNKSQLGYHGEWDKPSTKHWPCLLHLCICQKLDYSPTVGSLAMLS